MVDHLNNQFYPRQAAAALQSALNDPVFAEFSDMEKKRFLDAVIANLQKTIFSYNGPLDVKEYDWNDELRRKDAFVFYPMTAGEKTVSMAATAEDQWPSVLFREEDASSAANGVRFSPSIDMQATKKITLMWKREKFEEYDAEKNPHVEVIKKVNAYDRFIKLLPTIVDNRSAQGPSIGLRSYMPFRRAHRLMERRTPPYKYLKALFRAAYEKASEENLVRIEHQSLLSKLMRRYEKDIVVNLQKDIIDAFEAGWQQFTTHLNQDALRHMRTIGLDQDEIYGLLKSAPNASVMQFRAHAFQVFGRMGLARKLTEPRVKIVDEDAYRRSQDSFERQGVEQIPFLKNIDAGMPAFEAIKLYGLDDKLWRRAARLPVPPPENLAATMFTDRTELPPFLSLANLLPPQSKMDWINLEAFHKSVLGLYQVGFRDVEGDYKDDAADLIQRTWKTFKDKPKTWREFSRTLFGKESYTIGREILDTLKSLDDYILIPVLARAGARHEKLNTLFRQRMLGRYNLHHLLAASDYWHSERVRFQQRLSSFVVDDVQEWAPLVRNVTSPAGVQFRSLISKAHLTEEGYVMGHCVYSYTDNCVFGNSHILSLRDKDGNRLSTLELEEVENGEVAIAQHESFKRSTPSREAIVAAEWLVKEINEGRLKPDYKRIRNTRAKFQAQKESLRLGFDVNDLDKCEAIFKLYHPCIPPRVRERIHCIADYFREIGFDQDLAANGIPLPGAEESRSKSLPPELLALQQPPASLRRGGGRAGRPPAL